MGTGVSAFISCQVMRNSRASSGRAREKNYGANSDRPVNRTFPCRLCCSTIVIKSFGLATAISVNNHAACSTTVRSEAFHSYRRCTHDNDTKLPPSHRAQSTRRRPSGSKPDMAQDMQASTSVILDTESLLRSGERRRPCAAKTSPSSVCTPIARPPFSAACSAYSTCM